MLDLSTIIDYDIFKSTSTKKSKHFDPYGKDVFQVKPQPGFYAHLLALGPKEASSLLSHKIVWDIDEQQIYAPDGNKTTYNPQVHRVAWKYEHMTVMVPWDDLPMPSRQLEQKQKTERFRNSPVRISMTLPGIRTRKRFINKIYTVENIPERRYTISPRSLNFFLEFGVVAHPVPHGTYEDSKYDINPYNMVPSNYGQTKKPKRIYDADLGRYLTEDDS